MTVAEFIEFLKTKDQGATVECIEMREGRDWAGDTAYQVPFRDDLHWEYTDMRGNQFAKGKPYENSRVLFIGMR